MAAELPQILATVDDVRRGGDYDALVTAGVLHNVLMDLEPFSCDAFDFALQDKPYSRIGGRPIVAKTLRNIIRNPQGVEYIHSPSLTSDHLYVQGFDILKELLQTQEDLRESRVEINSLREHLLALRKEIALSQKLPTDLAKLTLEY